MLQLRKLMIENKISIEKLALNIQISRSALSCKLTKRFDFSIEELNKIKDYFVRNGAIENDFDIGEFLKEI